MAISPLRLFELVISGEISISGGRSRCRTIHSYRRGRPYAVSWRRIGSERRSSLGRSSGGASSKRRSAGSWPWSGNSSFGGRRIASPLLPRRRCLEGGALARLLSATSSRVPAGVKLELVKECCRWRARSDRCCRRLENRRLCSWRLLVALCDTDFRDVMLIIPSGLFERASLGLVSGVDYIEMGKSTTTAAATTVGTKRKAASISELKEWTCALCHVHATSERGLNEHFRGKKHRAKEEELRGRKSVKSQPPPMSEKMIDQPKIVKKVANSVQTQNQKQIKKPPVVNKPADQLVSKNEVVAPKKGKFTFMCQQCKIKCYNEPTMVAHLSGKKHLTRVKELETIGKGLTANVTSFEVTGKGDGAVGGLGKELTIEGESRRIPDEEAEVAEALTDEEEQEMEGQMDDDIEPVDELEEEGTSFFKLHMRGEQY